MRMINDLLPAEAQGKKWTKYARNVFLPLLFLCLNLVILCSRWINPPKNCIRRARQMLSAKMLPVELNKLLPVLLLVFTIFACIHKPGSFRYIPYSTSMTVRRQRNAQEIRVNEEKEIIKWGCKEIPNSGIITMSFLQIMPVHNQYNTNTCIEYT